jgi:hypothetical protein
MTNAVTLRTMPLEIYLDESEILKEAQDKIETIIPKEGGQIIKTWPELKKLMADGYNLVAKEINVH